MQYLMFHTFSVRKWKSKSSLGAQGQWQTEVGEPHTATAASLETEGIKENCANVCLVVTFSHLISELFFFISILLYRLL